MRNEHLALDVWRLGVAYYKRLVGYYGRGDPFASDCYWDATVEAMIATLTSYDGRVKLGWYFTITAKKTWSSRFDWLNRQKRHGKGFAQRCLENESNGIEQIDGAELAVKVKEWLDPESYDLWTRWLNDESMHDIGKRLVPRRTRGWVFYRIEKIRRFLRDKIEQSAPARAPII